MAFAVYDYNKYDKVVIIGIDNNNKNDYSACSHDIDFTLISVEDLENLIKENNGLLSKETLCSNSFTVKYTGTKSPYDEFLVKLSDEPPFDISTVCSYKVRRLKPVEKVVKTFK